MSELRFPTVATILGNPVYWDNPYRDHLPEQLASLKTLGVNTLFVNLAWSRPWMDAVTLEDVHISPTYPWLSDPKRVATNAPRLRQRTDAVVTAGLRPFFLFGCPTQINLGRLSPEAQATAATLIGQPTSRTTPGVAVACIQSPTVRQLYRELLAQHFAALPETEGILFYTVDELAEVCDEQDDCPACRGVPLHERLPDFLNYVRGVLDEFKPGVEMWWEPWEFTAAQTYAVAERLDPRITLSLHSSIHEVYYVNQPDLWLRHLCRLAADRGTGVIVELFLSGAGEDLGPVPSYPCPRLVIEQLRAVAGLPGVTGVKEYFGTVAEHISVNERAWRAFLRRPEADDNALLATLAEEYASDDRKVMETYRNPLDCAPDAVRGHPADCATSLLAAWEEAARAVEVYPWDVSWRLRHYNSVRYDQQLGQGYWSRSFTASLPTPWTTPSWESSRGAAYVVYLSTAVVNPRLIEETGQRLERCIDHLERALAHLQGVTAGAERQADLARQTDSLRIFRHLTCSRLNHLRASQLAARLRVTPAPAHYAKLETVLCADLANARALRELVAAGGYQGFDLPAFEQTVTYMIVELER
ncbi:MAG: hypothetical protein MUC51_16880, partial [Anaerolineae bacterium]|nr:hypothetical protein [Anaerolineae bacterium]